ncbi:MAG: beta-Ala-His dipeptidase [Bacteriovoracaceae bacterium]|nr:beta-Ala-His dipeptidase [Bacteriovoracaceae bacterium]
MSLPTDFPSQPKELWKHFYAFTQCPRPSGHEGIVREYVIGEAKKLGHEYKIDSVGNVLINVPASKGYESHPSVVIQNHLDMVTDATPDRKINFQTEPIKTYVEADWLKADRTTLGADNGIGCAAALALMTDDSIAHPPLELLFTIDEETGLTGALGIDPTLVKSKRMINLDTEEWGALYIGCAGGINYEFQKDITFASGNKNYKTYQLTVGGLRGGHSGIDIHMQVGNAMKLLNELLVELQAVDYELAEIRCGRAHNIIPREAYAYIRFSANHQKQVEAVIAKMLKCWKSYLPKDDSGLEVNLELTNETKEVVSENDKKQILSFISLFPHGAHRYLHDSEEPLVSMSNNLAIVLVMNGKWYALSSLRFFDREEVRALEQQMRQLSVAFNIQAIHEGEYPSWKPSPGNDLLEKVKSIYKENFKQEARVTAIHAGLECGVLRDRIGPIDAVSFGPTIMGAHSPQERVQISTVDKFWKLVVAVIEAL